MDVRFPIGELELPNKVTLVDVKQWMSEVETYIDQLKNVVDDLSDEQLTKNIEKVVGQSDNLYIILQTLKCNYLAA